MVGPEYSMPCMCCNGRIAEGSCRTMAPWTACSTAGHFSKNAFKAAIKAGQRLSESEMQQLFDALFATELPYHDVHGRPTIVALPSRELERKFGR